MSKPEKSLNKREAIVEQVIQIFSKLDLKQATIRKICDTAGISIGTFYHYFKDKNELLTEILLRIDPYLTESTSAKFLKENEIDNLIYFASCFARYAAGVGNATGSVISSGDIPLPSTTDEMLREQDRAIYKIPRIMIERGQEKGQITREADATAVSSQLVISLRGHVLEWSRRERCYSLEEKIHQFMLLLTRGMKP